MESINLSKAIQKWNPIIKEILNIDSSVNNIFCMYCEWNCINDKLNDLPYNLKLIKEKISSYKRIEIIGKFLNPISGMIEYKLENGQFIDVNRPYDYILSFDDKIELFGIEFVKYLDIKNFRDNQIDKIL